MPDYRSTFIHNENIRDFQRKLETETDPYRRRQLEKLISEAKAHRLPGFENRPSSSQQTSSEE